MKGRKVIAVNTSLGTNFLVSAHRSATFSELRDLIRIEHLSCFPDHGDIEVRALMVEHDDKQYCITNSLFVGQVFRKGWSKIHAVVSPGFPRNTPGNISRKKTSSNADITRAESSKPGTDSKLQGLSNRKRDKADVRLGNDSPKIGFFGPKGCSLLFSDDPYTQLLPGMSTPVTLDHLTMKNEMNSQNAKSEAWKDSPHSTKSSFDGFQKCERHIHCKQQAGKTKCTEELRELILEKCMQYTDNRRKEIVLELIPEALNDANVLGHPPLLDGAVLDQKMDTSITETESPSPKDHGLKSVIIERNCIIHRDEKLSNGYDSVETSHRCNYGNVYGLELNERASREYETAYFLNSDLGKNADEQLNSQNCFTDSSMQDLEPSVNLGFSPVLGYPRSTKTQCSPTKFSQDCGNKIESFDDEKSLQNGGCQKEPVTAHGLSPQNVNVAAKAAQQKSSQTTGDGKIPCPAGCGRLYAGKTSSWYRHRRKCTGHGL